MVSNEELLRDIELTERELEAYQKLMEGFYVLMNLPENTDLTHKVSYLRYSSAEKDCSIFLRKLYALKKERGF